MPSPVSAPFNFYGKFFQNLFDGYIDLLSQPMYCILCTGDYQPNQNTHQWYSDIRGEVVGSGYYSGGQQVTGASAAFVVSGSNKQLIVSGSNLVWPNVILNDVEYAVLYMANSGVGPTLQPLIGYLNLASHPQSPNDLALYLNWNPNGIFAINIPGAT